MFSTALLLIGKIGTLLAFKFHDLTLPGKHLGGSKFWTAEVRFWSMRFCDTIKIVL